MKGPSARGLAFGLVVAIAIGAAVAYVWRAAGERTEASPRSSTAAPIATSGSVVPGGPGGYIAFRRTAIDSSYGTVGLVPLGDPTAAPTPTPLSCERIDVSRNGGICLDVDRGSVSTAKVLLLRPDLTVEHVLETSGIPSRARVSADGRWAATTTFVTGHSYASAGFSTRTEIYDMRAGTSLGNVESFALSHRDKPYRAADVNVWGVTFTPDGTSFYATVMSRGTKYLAHGDIAARTLVMLDVPAECPSLSPSGRLLAYKSSTGPVTWEIRVRTLADGSEVVVKESRSVDDQIAWLDDEHVVFGLARPEGGAAADVWVAPADGSADAERLLTEAWSPAIVPPR